MLRAARRLLRRKDRQLARRFLAEGRQAISEALDRPGTVVVPRSGGEELENTRPVTAIAHDTDVAHVVIPP